MAEVEAIDTLAWKVQKRLIAINMHVVQHVRDIEGTKQQKVVRTRIRPLEALREQGHEPQKQDRGWRCKGCHCTYKQGELGKWARKGQRCSKLFGQKDELLHARTTARIHKLVIGKAEVHKSHKLAKKEDIIFCEVCGSWGQKRLRKLGHVCKPATQEGNLVIKKLKAGKPPKRNIKWDPRQRGSEIVKVFWGDNADDGGQVLQWEVSGAGDDRQGSLSNAAFESEEQEASFMVELEAALLDEG